MSTARDAATELLAQAFGMSVSEIGDDTSVGVTPQWDSLAHMRLILAMEDRLKRSLDPKEIVSIEKLSDVVSLLAGEEKGIK